MEIRVVVGVAIDVAKWAETIDWCAAPPRVIANPASQVQEAIAGALKGLRFIVPEGTSIVAVGEVPADGPAVIKKRGRGRPKKVVAAAVVLPVDPPTKRKRGRPRKAR